MLTDATHNAMLDELGTLITHVSLHTAYDAAGSNEVSGGSYARQAVTWSSAASASLAMSGTETFEVPGSTTVRFVGGFSALTAGTFRGMWPLGSTGYLEVQADTTNDLIRSAGHGFSNGDNIVFLGGTAPGGLTSGTVYFVVGATTDTFQASATSGGSAIDLTTVGDADVIVSKIVPETFSGAGQYQLSGLTHSLS